MTSSRRFLAHVLGLVAVTLTAMRAAHADVIVIRFAPPCFGGAATPWESYSESGFTLTAPGSPALGSYCVGNSSYGGPGAYVNVHGATASLTKNDGGTFGLASIDLAPLFSYYAVGGPVTFIGHLLGGGLVTQAFGFFPVLGTPVFTTYSFASAFANVTSVDFLTQVPAGSTPAYQFTNIVITGVNAAPEPRSVFLLGTGLIVLAGLNWRRRRSANEA